MKKKIYRDRYGIATNHTEEKGKVILTKTTKFKKKKGEK